MTIYAERAQCADHLRCALAALIAEASKGKIGLHGVHTRRFLIAQEQIDAFLQLRTDSFSVIFVILVGRNGLHQHSHHIDAKVIRAVLMGQDRLQQGIPCPYGILGNCVITHIQRYQRKNRAVDGVATGIVIEYRCQIANRLSIGIYKRIVFCGIGVQI